MVYLIVNVWPVILSLQWYWKIYSWNNGRNITDRKKENWKDGELFKDVPCIVLQRNISVSFQYSSGSLWEMLPFPHYVCTVRLFEQYLHSDFAVFAPEHLWHSSLFLCEIFVRDIFSRLVWKILERKKKCQNRVLIINGDLTELAFYHYLIFQVNQFIRLADWEPGS